MRELHRLEAQRLRQMPGGGVVAVGPGVNRAVMALEDRLDEAAPQPPATLLGVHDALEQRRCALGAGAHEHGGRQRPAVRRGLRQVRALGLRAEVDQGLIGQRGVAVVVLGGPGQGQDGLQIGLLGAQTLDGVRAAVHRNLLGCLGSRAVLVGRWSQRPSGARRAVRLYPTLRTVVTIFS